MLDFSGNARIIQIYCMLDKHKTEFHLHTRGQLLFVQSGTIIILAGGHSYTIYPNNCIWIPPNLEHKAISYTRSELYSLFIDPDASKSLSSTPSIMTASPLFSQLVECYNSQSQEALNQEVIESLISLLLMEIRKSSVMQMGMPLPKDKRLLIVCDKLFEDPLGNRTIAELLVGIPISYRHAVRLFKDQTGLCFGQWRIYLKLYIAMMLLMSGKSITWVAYETGYSNLSGFSVAFKKEFGIAPKEFVSGVSVDLLTKNL